MQESQNVSNEKVEHLPPPERPRERLLSSGPSSLSLRECLAILLGAGPKGLGSLGLARSILVRIGASDEDPAPFHALVKSGDSRWLDGVHGIGIAGKCRLLAASELARRQVATEAPAVRSLGKRGWESKALGKVPRHLREDHREWMGYVPICQGWNVGPFVLLDRGSRFHVNLDPGELFKGLLIMKPLGFVLFHNHPSESTMPSSEDIRLTREVEDLGLRLGCPLLSHWIVTKESQRRVVTESSS